MDRRTLIKRGAAAGAIAWTTPTILSGTAQAFDGRFTGCVPDPQYVLTLTGSNCSDWNTYVNNNFPGLLPTLSPSCCEKSTYGVVIPDGLTCGAACEAQAIPIPGSPFTTQIRAIVASTGGDFLLKNLQDDNEGCNYTPDGDFKFVDGQNCSADASVTLDIVTAVKCEDGNCYLVEDIVEFDTPNCPASSPGTVIARNILPISCPS